MAKLNQKISSYGPKLAHVDLIRKRYPLNLGFPGGPEFFLYYSLIVENSGQNQKNSDKNVDFW